jgi:uncharacterized membrane protein (DUF2068 family)
VKVYRPLGVTVIATFLIFFAALELIAGILAEPFYEGMIIGPIEVVSFFNQIQPAANTYLQQVKIATIYGNLSTLISAVSMSSYVDFLIVVIMTFAGLHLFASVGLFSMRKWGYKLALIIGAISISIGLSAIFELLIGVGNIAIGLSPIILPILVFLVFNLFLGTAIIAYLLGKTKYEFE